MKTLSFIALDLETTGLSPEIDTIIEIAAIKFDIIFDGKNFSLENIIKKTMLINPDRLLDEEIILITHITNEMLADKPKWSEVRDNVANFIKKDDIILGHNVLFDVAMLKTHGIDLMEHHILDTFELSEILTQNAESLNLGFLGDFYGIEKKWQEHRALTDTGICLDLFLVFLKKLSSLSGLQKTIFETYFLSTNSPFGFLHVFFEKNWQENIFLDEWKNSFEENFVKNFQEKKWHTQKVNEKNIFPYKNISNPKEEIDFIRENIKKYGKIQIITTNKKSAENLEETLEKSGISAKVWCEWYHFISPSALFESIEKRFWKHRKYDIFLLKMLFWLSETKTGLVAELKYYGEEFSFLENLRLSENEKNIFLKNHEKSLESIDVIISSFQKNISTEKYFTLYKDISLMEGVIRKNLSLIIDIENLIEKIEQFPLPESENLIHAVRNIETVYHNVPERPMGENPIPPGKYGETYFFKQNNLWHKGCKWLSLSNRGLFQIFEQWKEKVTSYTTREEILNKKYIIEKINMLILYETQELPNIGVIMSIINEKTTLEFIAQKLDITTEKFFKNAIGYGFHLEAEGVENFVEREFWTENILSQKYQNNNYNSLVSGLSRKQYTKFLGAKEILEWKKIVILTTNTKHIREMGEKLKKHDFTVLLQGTSGGKSKISHYFSQNPDEKSILVGLLDAWRDEAKVLKNADTLVIAKIPFDPPTDPQFLAKTVGMSNSFELYSKPIVLSRLNTLISNALAINPNIKIICSDERLETTEWGKFIKKNLA